MTNPQAEYNSCFRLEVLAPDLDTAASDAKHQAGMGYDAKQIDEQQFIGATPCEQL